jgi:hypothetical protein
MTAAPSPTRLIASTPHATPVSIAPAAINPAIRWFACCEEPHCASTVVAATSYASPMPSHAFRVTLHACSPACVTHPPMT